ncbi:MAG TPA: polyamine aminopropyltransferase [Candidatus Monoglobus merdigallinarum]|uniref:Polyamine aminopropyltransferase n=1 Tax=Candidatus Monoglobus merdigallinarum TaxID=2838698 RepID=A0A9D1TMA1_9FIRM|nr:polyamine aminopropyltransferase [Candidatus Monoglobus merdigallinarum]
MELWYSENHSRDVQFSIRVEKQLYTAQTEFQRIDVMTSNEFGTFLTLDGLMMVAEKDEFIYHEMITHVPMSVNPGIENVLVIGGGDGGTVNQLVRYGGIKHIDLVEIDREVIEVSKRFFPELSAGMSDKRVSIYYEDGLRFIRSRHGEYDLIIVDSTDPFGPGEGLFTREFYGSCSKALTENGILVNQHESPYYEDYANSLARTHARIKGVFPIHRLYQAHIPTYPSGHWLFGFASNKFDPVLDIKAEEWNRLNIKTRYYNTELHKGSFALPNYVKELLENV